MRAESAAPEQLEAPTGELIGDEIDGRFRVVERIGSGGMGSIFRVEHIELKRQFALKVLKAELSNDAAMVERFRKEARIAASLSSEHVVAIVDSGILRDGRPYFVMDLLIGSDLRRLLAAHGTLPPARVANLGVDVCRGLAAAHAAGLIHRDLKPENLFVTRGDDGRDVCKILDFGVAKGGDIGATRPGMLVGTVRYMASEQVGLDAPVGPRTDLYALGVILYECLCGVAPLQGDTTERALYAIMNGTPTPLRERLPELSTGLAAVVMRAFAREPEERYPDALALGEALLPYAAGRRASFAEAWWVDVSPETTVGSGRHSTPALTLAPAGRRLASRSAASEPAAEPVRRSFPWRVVGASLLAGALASSIVRSVVEGVQRRATEAPSAPVVLRGAEPASAATAPENVVRAVSPPIAVVSVSVNAPPSAAPAPPAPVVRQPLAAGASSSRPGSPASSSEPIPRLSFDSENPYAK
jgi:eukaryotic-like serine/threonine-protein kinase